MDCTLKINPEFEDVIPPISKKEFQQLENNIIAEGEILSPIIVWNGYIVDGHNRYKILQKHPELKYKIFEKHFENKYEVISWICNNQIGARNLSKKFMKYLRGKQYDAEKQSIKFKGNQHIKFNCEENISDEISGGGYNSHHQKRPKTRELLSKKYGVSESQIKYDQQFSRGIDAAEEVEPGIKYEILNSKIHPTDKAVSEIAKIPVEKRKEAIENLRIMTDRRKLPRNNTTNQSVTRITPDTEADKIAPVNEDDILNTLDAAVNNLIDMCNNYFTRFPKLLSDDNYRDKTITTLKEFQKYIATIERNERYDNK